MVLGLGTPEHRSEVYTVGKDEDAVQEYIQKEEKQINEL